MEDTNRNNDGTVNLGGNTDIPVDETKVAMVQKPGALKIYDGALSPDFCEELINVFNANEDAHEDLEDGVMKFKQYNYTLNHSEDDVHGRLMAHLAELFKQYLKDIGTGLHIKLSGFEQLRIKRYTADTDDKFDVHVDVVDHDST